MFRVAIYVKVHADESADVCAMMAGSWRLNNPPLCPNSASSASSTALSWQSSQGTWPSLRDASGPGTTPGTTKQNRILMMRHQKFAFPQPVGLWSLF